MEEIDSSFAIIGFSVALIFYIAQWFINGAKIKQLSAYTAFSALIGLMSLLLLMILDSVIKTPLYVDTLLCIGLCILFNKSSIKNEVINRKP